MREFLPVWHKGHKYRRITAFIWRVVESRSGRGTYREVLQLELEDYCGNSVTIAKAEEVELIDNGLIENV